MTPHRFGVFPRVVRASFRAALAAGALSLVALLGCTRLSGPTSKYAGLNDALQRMVTAERARDWAALYATVAPEFREGQSSEVFSYAMEAYARRRSLVSWQATAVRRAPRGSSTSDWLFVEGCGCYLADGRYEAWVAATIAVPRNAVWRFAGISIATPVDGSPTRCQPRLVPDGPCRQLRRPRSAPEG